MRDWAAGNDRASDGGSSLLVILPVLRCLTLSHRKPKSKRHLTYPHLSIILPLVHRETSEFRRLPSMTWESRNGGNTVKGLCRTHDMQEPEESSAL